MTDNRARGDGTGSQATVSAGSCAFGDPSLHEQAVKPWELLTTSLSRGDFRHEMRYVGASTFSIYAERFAGQVRLRGQSPPGVIALAVPIRVPPHSLCWKQPWWPERIQAIQGDALDVLLDAGHEQVVVLIEGCLMRRELGEERAESLERLCRSRGWPSTQRKVAQLRGFLLALIDAVIASPRLLQTSTSRHSIETDLTRNIAAAVAVPPEEDQAGPCRRARAGRGRLMARVLEVVRATNSVDLSIPQLCDAAGVNQRSLEYAFRETFDLTPLAFLRLRRLHSARIRLLAADPADMAVTDVAYQEGFYHRGRFATAYQSTFGEHPSQTLGRPCPRELSHLMVAGPIRLGE